MNDLHEAVLRLAASHSRLMEAVTLDYSTAYGLDPRDMGIGDHPGFLAAGGNAGLTWLNRRGRGDFIPAFLNAEQLALYRKRIRALVVNNEIALNAVNTHQSYAVGEGFSYECSPRRASSDPAVVADTQAVVDAFVEHNELALREGETLARILVDGEAIHRLFPTSSGILAMRWVEPEYLRSPTGDDGLDSFGVRSRSRDVESVDGYWIDEGLDGKLVFVDPSEIVHFKHPETPATSKRGLSAFYPVESALRAAEDLLYSTVAMAKARAKIAWIQKLEGMTADVASALTAAQATVTGTDPTTNEALTMERYRYGTILRTNTDIEMPSANIAASDHVAVLQMVLRVIAARFSMPEYMLSSDASNANYSSTLVAESPFVKAMQRLQDYLARLLGRNRYPGPRQSLVWRQIYHAVERRILPREALTDVTVQVEGPSLVIRDVSKEAQVDEIYHRMGVKSKKTIQLEQGLDPDEEDVNFKTESPVATPRPLAESADWDESKHERADDGKFGSGGTSGTKHSPRRAEYEAARKDYDLREAKRHVQRQAADRAPALADGLYKLGDAMLAQDVVSSDDAIKLLMAAGADRVIANLKTAGVPDSDLAKLTKAVERGKSTLSRAVSSYQGKLAKVTALQAEAPSESPEPEPTRGDSSKWDAVLSDPAVEADSPEAEEAEREIERIDAAHAKVVEAWERREERREAKRDAWEERLDAATEAATETLDSVRDAWQDHWARIDDVVEDLAGDAHAAIDEADVDDNSPDEADYEEEDEDDDQ